MYPGLAAQGGHLGADIAYDPQLDGGVPPPNPRENVAYEVPDCVDVRRVSAADEQKPLPLFERPARRRYRRYRKWQMNDASSSELPL
jgi:hypothetical protein